MPEVLNLGDVYEKSYKVLVYLRDRTNIPIFDLIESSTEEELRAAIAAC